jgi:hypothetical protein
MTPDSQGGAIRRDKRADPPGVLASDCADNSYFSVKVGPFGGGVSSQAHSNRAQGTRGRPASAASLVLSY